jgi:hypothetical protein
VLSEVDEFFFDVNGFLVVEDILPADLLAALRDAFERGGERIGELGFSLAKDVPGFVAEHRRTEFDAPFGWPDPWGAAFRRVLALPAAVRLMLDLIGNGFRLDSMKGTVMTPGTEGFRLHGASGIPGDIRFYQVRAGCIRNGLVNIAYALTDVPPGAGGFCCIPGSHKANFVPPVAVRDMRAGADHVRQIPVRAGSAVVFSEALTHGTLPWTGSGDRRTLFVRYSPGAAQFRPDPLPDDYPAYAGRLTPLQRAIFDPPRFNARPDIQALLDEESAAAQAGHRGTERT